MTIRQRFSSLVSSRGPGADLIVYCHDGMLSEGLRCHLLAHSCSLRITTVCTEAAFSEIVVNSTVPLLVILSGALSNALMQFRVMHQHQCARRKQMVLCRGDAYGLRTLLPFFKWFSMHAPVTHHIRNIMTWLAETDRPSTPPPLSSLIRRQREILLRLGICWHTRWTLLCAAVRSVDFYSGMCGAEPDSVLQTRHEKQSRWTKNEN